MAKVKKKMKVNKATHELALVPGQEGRREQGERRQKEHRRMKGSFFI